MQAHQSYCNY